MNPNRITGRRTSALLASLLAGVSLLGAADEATPAVPATPGNVTSGSTQNDEIARLQAALAAQQKQLEALRQALEQQQKLLQSTIHSAATPQNQPASLGTVASLTPVIPAPAPAPLALPTMATPRPQAAPAQGGNPCEAAPDANSVPPYLRLGNTCIVPVGFMDLTSVWRDKNAGSSMGSNFGSIPYNNTVNGNLSEFRFTPQNSRIGFRVDGDWKGVHFIGYNEFDFNGTSGSNGIAVSNGAFVPRLRLFWVDARKGKLEFLAGQSWSLLTPNRKGLSALPGDLFYSQVVDINYIAGLTWTRQPGMRIIYHPNEQVTFGFSAEQPDQYAGGSAGGSTITFPANFAIGNSQLDISQNVSAGQNILNQPTVTPDFIAKVAFDPNSRFHVDLAGIERNFKTVNPALLSQHFTAEGGGVELGINAEIFKGFRLINTDYWSDGGGRYIFGQAPDLIVRGNGTLSLVHSGGFIGGFEDTIKNTLLYGYYGLDYIGRDVAIDANGKSLVGYGFTGSANSQNRAINEITFGFNQTMWKNPRYGAINLMGQYEWLERDPWYVAVGAPKNTHDNTIYVNVRYTLPGSMPNF
jgi:hypothetical protein